jgi:Tfp pilus assembly protein PilX
MKHTQQGSTLLVSLVLLTSITIGAIYAMQRSGSQLKLVSTQQHKQLIDGYAQSETEGGLSYLRNNISQLNAATRALQLDNDNNVVVDGNGNPVTSPIDIYADPNDQIPIPDKLNMNSSLRFTGNQNRAGIALADGSSSGQTIDYFFEIQSTVSQRNGRLASERHLGFRYNAPRWEQ